MSEWISVEDRLPDAGSYVLAAIPYSFLTGTKLEKNGFTVITLIYDKGEEGAFWFDDRAGEEQQDITHWMPLPKPPTEE